MNSLTKIEKKAINTLEVIIDNHETIDYQFNYADKEMSWDGYISIPKDISKEIKKSNFGGRIPVQIKGHEDQDCKYINKQTVTWDVELDDLRNYATEKGVLYFQIFVNSKKGEVFYASLFPSKIIDILERAEKKGNKKSKRIPFIKMAKDPMKMESIFKQFNEEAKKQGSASNPLVIDRIRADEFKKIKVLNFTVFGVHNTIDALMRIPSGDICLYGKLEGDKYLRPLETMNSAVVSVKEEVDQTIKIGEEVYYNHFQRITNSKDGVTVILSPNLQINLTHGKISFHVVSSVEDMYRDVRFMCLIKNNAIIQHGIEASVLEDIKASEGFDNQINHIIALYEAMKTIGLDVSIPFPQYSDEQKAQLAYLAEIKLGKHNDKITEKFMKYLWKFGDKYVPLLIIKENNEIELCNAVYTERYIICLPKEENNEEMGERIPLFAYQSVDVLSNLYHYDYDAFSKQIDRCDITDNSIGTLIHVALLMINVYDKSGDVHFLDLSEYLLKRIEQHEQSIIITLNILQIKKRKGEINESDITILNEISDEDNSMRFGKNVLLGNKEAALECFSKFSEEEKAECMDYPIYTLFLQI